MERRTANAVPSAHRARHLPPRHVLSSQPDPAAPALSRRAFLAAAALGAVASGVALHAARDAGVEVVRTVAPGADAPWLRIALLTDLHAPQSAVDVAALGGVVRAFDPHFVFIVGDSIDRAGTAGEVRAFDALAARHGVFATLGNHEHWSGCDLGLLRREYERAGVRLLVNGEVTVDVDGRPVRVVGLDDWRAARPDYRLVAERRPGWREAARRLVLSHCPVTFDHVRAATALPMDVFAGHTHAGQVAPFGRPLVLPSGSGRYVKGWYGGPAAQRLYVSRGLGTSGVPLRIGARPELTLMTI